MYLTYTVATIDSSVIMTGNSMTTNLGDIESPDIFAESTTLTCT